MTIAENKPKTTVDINAWMITRGINPNTYQQYRKETKKYGHTSKGFTDEFIEWYLFRCSEAELKLLKERSVLPEFKGDFKDNQLKMIAEYQFNQPITAQEIVEVKKRIIEITPIMVKTIHSVDGKEIGVNYDTLNPCIECGEVRLCCGATAACPICDHLMTLEEYNKNFSKNNELEEEQMENAIKIEKEFLKKEQKLATIEDYQKALAEERLEANTLYNKIQALQDERDTLKEQIEYIKNIKSVSVVSESVESNDNLKFLYNLMDNKMVFKSKLIEEWRSGPENKSPIIITQGEFLLKLRDWEKECPITQQEVDKINEITKIMENDIKRA